MASLRIWSHLDWVNNVGYAYGNFHYNPAHMIAVSLFLLRPGTSTAWVANLSAANLKKVQKCDLQNTKIPFQDSGFDRAARHT